MVQTIKNSRIHSGWKNKLF